MTTNNFCILIGWTGGRAFDHHRKNAEGGGAFANKNCLQGRAFEKKIQMPGVCPGGRLADGKFQISIFMYKFYINQLPAVFDSYFLAQQSKYIAIGESLFTYFASLAYVS